MVSFQLSSSDSDDLNGNKSDPEDDGVGKVKISNTKNKNRVLNALSLRASVKENKANKTCDESDKISKPVQSKKPRSNRRRPGK